jgi:hypothetical protein
MNDITEHYRVQQILIEAAQFRTLRAIYAADPNISPRTASLLRDCFRMYRDDPADLRKIAHGSPGRR